MPDSLTPVLSNRALGRATLARQMLLERVERDPLDAVEFLVGLQAQTPTDPYCALWARLAGFDPMSLSRAVEARQAVRAVVMRGTIHLLTRRDALSIWPRMAPVSRRVFAGARMKHLAPELDDILEAGRALLQEGPLTRAEIHRRLLERWPDAPPDTLGSAVTYALPLVQTTPRGQWDKSSRATVALMEQWLGGSLRKPMPLLEMVRRYLAAFGPASVMDVQAWCGLTRLKDTVEAMRPGLVTFRSEDRRELFDLPDAPRPPEDTPAPVRFLPQFDNVLLSHAERSRIITPEVKGQRTWLDRWVGSILVDGMVAAAWTLRRGKRQATLVVEPLAIRRLTKPERREIIDEGGRLLAFAAPGDSHDIEFAAPV